MLRGSMPAKKAAKASKPTLKNKVTLPTGERITVYASSKGKATLENAVRKAQELADSAKIYMLEAPLQAIVRDAHTVAPSADSEPAPVSGTYAAIETQVRNVQRWRDALRRFGISDDIAIARGGDLIHDIAKAAASRMPTGLPAPASASMIDFLTTYDPVPGTSAPTLHSFIPSVPAIQQAMRNFRLYGIAPELYARTKVGLKSLTDKLLASGVETIVLDAQFGNLFKDGFGRGMTLLMSAASEIDGASKVGQASVLQYGVSYMTDATTFSFPDFLRDTLHTISKDSTGNHVTVTDGGRSVTISCTSGISVNAICNLVGLSPPRGSGNEGVAVTIDAGGTLKAYVNHKIVLVKTMTDWAQLVYAYLLIMAGRLCVLITNDYFLLALAAALGLAHVIRTPFAGCETIEYYQFDPVFAPLTQEQQSTIVGKLAVDVPTLDRITESTASWASRFERAERCMEAVNVPAPIRAKFLVDAAAAAAEYQAIVDDIRAASEWAAAGGGPSPFPFPIDKYRSLLFVDLDKYLKEQEKRLTVEIATTYVSIGTRIHSIISNRDKFQGTDAIFSIYNIISELGLGYPDILTVFNHLTGNPVIDVQPDGMAAVRERGDRVWQTYYRFRLRELDATLGLAVPVFSAYAKAPDGELWDNQMNSMKQAIHVLIEGYSGERPFVYSGPPCAQAGGGEAAAEESLNNAEEGTVDAINEMIALYKLRDPEGPYKPSCVVGIDDQILRSFASPDPRIKVNEFVDIFDRLSLDADETNLYASYTAKLSDIYEWRDAVLEGTMSYDDFLYSTAATLATHDAYQFVLEVLSNSAGNKLLDELMYTDIPNMDSESLRNLNRAGRVSNASRKNMERGRLARDELRARGEMNRPKESPVMRKGFEQVGPDYAVSKSGAVATGEEQQIVYASTSSGRQSGSGRAHRRRTRRRGSRAAAKRGRTFRRRR